MNKNKKYIFGLTKEEFTDAIKTIISAKDENKEKDVKEQNSLIDNPKIFYKKCVAFIKDIITLKFIIKLKDEIKGLIKDLMYILKFEFVKDIISWCKTPLTKELFIQRGIKLKFALSETIETIIFVLIMVIFIRFFICEIRWIPSGSMNPTLIEGDRIVVERSSRFYTTPKRGDIMVFYPPSTKLSYNPIALLSRLTGILCNDVAYIKRVIGLPGEKIEIKFEDDGSAYVYINDKKYKEDYIKNIYEYPLCPPKGLSQNLLINEMKCGPFQLGSDEYFMMGDNRGNSQDSRYWGVLKKDRFIGRAISIFWPLKRKQELKRINSTNDSTSYNQP